MWCTVDDIGDVITGGTPSKSNSLFYGRDYPFFKPTDLEQGVNVTSSIDGLSELGFQNSRQLPPLSILVTCIGATIGKTGLIRKAGSCNQQINAIVPNGLMYAELIYFFITSEWFQQCIKSNSSATTLPILNKNNFAKLYFPIPPQKEQNRILTFIKSLWNSIDEIDVDVLDLKNYLNSTKNNTLELAISGKLVPQDPADEPAEELLRRINPAAVPADKSHYIIPSSWVWVKLEDIFEINPKNHNNDDDECGFVPMANVQDGYSGKHTFEVRKWREVKKGYCHFQNGDIAVAKISPCFENLKSVIMRSLPNNIGAGTTELVILRSKEVFAPYFLYLFKSPWYISKGTVYFKGVVGQQRVSRDIFTKLAVPMPPLNEQKRIVAKVDELFALIDTIQQSLE